MYFCLLFLMPANLADVAYLSQKLMIQNIRKIYIGVDYI